MEHVINEHVSSLQPVQNPEIYSELAWDVQVSEGYIENNGKLKLGQDMFNFQQLLSSQDKVELQELICKFLVSSSRSGTEYGVDFVQRVRKINQTGHSC